MNKEKKAEKFIEKKIKTILERELVELGGGTGSFCFYQPQEPRGLERYKYVKQDIERDI